MKVEVACRHCDTLLRVSAEHIGKQVRCPNCSRLSLIEPISKPENVIDAGVELVDQSSPSSNPFPTSGPSEEKAWPTSPVHPQHSTPHYVPGPAEPPYPVGYRHDGKDTLSLVLGGLAIVSVFMCACFTIIITPVLAGIGYNMAATSNGPNRTAGKVTNQIALGLWVLASLFWIVAIVFG